jgi:hypothetical protein
MAYKKEELAGSFEFEINRDFVGYNSSRDKTNISQKYIVEGSQNVYKTISGTWANRPGQKRRGVADNTYSPISSQYVWNTSIGSTLPLEITNSTLRVEFNNAYYNLLTGLTKTRYVFDKWWDNTEKKDRVLFVCGDSNIYHWSGGATTVASGTANTITKQGSTSWQQAMFSTTTGEKKIMIGGVEYTYTGGETTTTLTGVSPTAVGLVAGTVALQSVITTANSPVTGYNNDFIKVINSQLYVGSYTSRVVYISSNVAFANFTVPTPTIAGSPELLTLDSNVKGIGVRKGDPHIPMLSGNWAKITFTDVTVGTTLTRKTTVDIIPGANLTGAYAHEFIENVGDTLIYLSQDQQMRTVGDFATIFATAFPSFSQDVYSELAAETFTGGGLKSVGDFLYLTAPVSGKTYIYQVRQSVNEYGQVLSERFWHAPQVWNITRVDVIGNVAYGYSNSNPQVYQLWNTGQWYDDSPSDEPLPYKCSLTTAYNDNGRRQGLLSFDKLFSEGYISEGSPLNVRVRYNYNGETSILDAIVNNIEQPAYLFKGTSPASLGDSSLGDNPLGDSTVSLISSTQTLPKFKVINTFSLTNVFEYQIEYYSEAASSRWEILAYGTNLVKETQQQATFIINKVKR